MSIEVSVIIPNYNCKPYLAKAISSIVRQENISYEILVVDDGSTDGSVEWLENLQKTLPEIRVIAQPNTGVVKARNRAISEAKGDYIAFLDADDYWTDDKLYNQINYMKQNSDCVLSFTNYMHVNEKYEPIIDCFSYWPEFSKFIDKNSTGYQNLKSPMDLLLFANVIGTSSVVVKKSAISFVGKFDTSLNSASDWDCWLKLARIGDVAFSLQTSMGYLMRAGSITANRKNRLNAMKVIISRCKNDTGFDTKLKAKARMLECYGEYYREIGLKFKALRITAAAFMLFPHKRNFQHLLHDIKQTIKPS
ncbi:MULTISPECIES: glycosyltransferase family 2 protein [unclassified Pseudoalteromonas]|uniref:glycosyltransferase family 2 protein n=1 Tax=unclassified Pseudoalteromonas TaxID=194690 RepID=UPI0002AA674F|nr:MULTISPECIES: glycosyltransferase family 2 protein [unclassified Pseudoalteromonas]ALQ07879.1 glycosyl transferase [Pseudoalteromonas sp. Bsw20308]KDC55933.1 glycosyl transferase [Pseudoalteromonas sp. S3431]